MHFPFIAVAVELFRGPYLGTRDPMLLKIGSLWHCYYMGNKEKEEYRECPFVVEREGFFYLFRNLTYGQTATNIQQASRNPLAFGVGTDRFRVGLLRIAAPEIVLHKGQYYVAALEPDLDGIKVAKLKWVKQP